jgi:hypothetical protein
MMETLFGSGATVWSPLSAGGFFLPPPGGMGATAATPPVLPAPAAAPAQAFGYPGGMTTLAPTIAPHGFGSPLLFAPHQSPVLWSPLAGDPAAGGTIPLLLMSIALSRGQPNGPTTDQEIEDFVYDVFEVLPGVSDVEVRCEAGRTTLTGSVQHKRVKRDIGEIVWAIPSVADVQNNVTIASRRRPRTATREGEPLAAAARKPA